jgi:zinc protease
VLDREWRRLLYGPDHYTVREVLPRHVDALTPQDLTAFHRMAWRPESMVVAVSGDVATGDVLARLERCFSGWPAVSGPAPSWPPPASSQVPRPGLYAIERDIPQAKMFLGHLATKRGGWNDPDEFPLLLMNGILGGNGNRLLRKLRGEMGLAYRGESAFELGTYEPGAFQIFLETGNASAARVLQVALAEVRRLREGPVPPGELAFVKKILLDNFPLLFDTPSEVAGRFAEDEYLGRPHDYWRTWRDRVQRVTAEQIQQAAQRYLQPDRMVIVVAGRWDEIQKGAAAAGVKVELLAKGPVTRLPARDPMTLEPAAR